MFRLLAPRVISKRPRYCARLRLFAMTRVLAIDCSVAGSLGRLRCRDAVARVEADLMSDPELRSIIELHVDFIVQNTTKAGVPPHPLQCHQNDGWGPSKEDPEGQEGMQDCLLDRYQLCAQQATPASNDWFDFTACVFRNQKETDTTSDKWHAFDLTVEYCARVSRQDYGSLRACAESDEGRRLLAASHEITTQLNKHIDAQGHRHPDWVIIDGIDYNGNTTANWAKIVCNAYTGANPPKACRHK